MGEEAPFDRLAVGAVLDRLADAVVVADASNRIVYVNSATERLLG